jgi:hypothetical protein
MHTIYIPFDPRAPALRVLLHLQGLALPLHPPRDLPPYSRDFRIGHVRVHEFPFWGVQGEREFFAFLWSGLALGGEHHFGCAGDEAGLLRERLRTPRKSPSYSIHPSSSLFAH